MRIFELMKIKLQRGETKKHKILDSINSKRTNVPLDQLVFDTDPSWTLQNIQNNVIHDLSYAGFLNLISPANQIIDIGANYGYSFSTFYNLGYRGNYLAFEPLIQHRPALTALVDNFPIFTYEPIAIGELNQKIEICIPSFKSQAKSALSFMEFNHFHYESLLENLLPKRQRFWKCSDVGFTWTNVEMKTLDSILSILGKLDVVDGIKIDVEGYEAQVLRGGLQTIQQFKPALLIEGANRNSDVVDILLELGYIFLVEDKNNKYRVGDIYVYSDQPNGVFIHQDNLRLYHDLNLILDN
jgi:FkbM family methyltransferase